MTKAKVKFESIDERTQQQAGKLAEILGAAGGKRVTLQVDGDLAMLLKNIASLVAETSGLAYGALSSELSPEQAGKILGVSRPLVVRRMDDGRLPFFYVGAHRRCKLEDVLKLRAEEERQSSALKELAEGIADIIRDDGANGKS